jgi:hypothetical protein
MGEPPAFEREADEVFWVIQEALKTSAKRGAAYRSCEAKHQAVVAALEDCAAR